MMNKDFDAYSDVNTELFEEYKKIKNMENNEFDDNKFLEKYKEYKG